MDTFLVHLEAHTKEGAEAARSAIECIEKLGSGPWRYPDRGIMRMKGTAPDRETSRTWSAGKWMRPRNQLLEK